MLVLVYGEQPILLVADSESAAGVDKEINIETYKSYSIDASVDSIAGLSSMLVSKLRNIPAGRVGVECDTLPMAVCEKVRAECPQLQLFDVTELMAGMRVIKDKDEIAILRQSCWLCDIGQELVMRHAQPGITEIELFAEVRRGMEIADGGRLPLLADLVSGPRTALIGGAPSHRRIESGDLVLADLVPRHEGYWGDSCNTCAVDESTREQQACFESVSEILRQAIEMIRPGLRACDLDEFVRGRIRKVGGEFPHHVGHGIGVTWHEEPRIVPYNTQRLAADMVIALEPGVYWNERWGMRLEHVVRVTNDGAEILSGFKHSL
jgi:Xaa-Pro aminopeptidase